MTLGRSINLILDWDGTLTRKDTMFAMAEIAAARDRRLGKDSIAMEQWAGFGKAYMDDYSTHESSYNPKQYDRNEITAESTWLRSLHSVELTSVSRVEDSGFFRGVTRTDIEDAAARIILSGEITLRAGWEKALLQSYGTNASRVSLLSVNWSETFIRAALRKAAYCSTLSEATCAELVNAVDELDIRTNEIADLDTLSGSSGLLSSEERPGIRTSSDKLQNLQLLPDHVNVYVGDSATDFDCLLSGEIGICMRDEHMSSSQRNLADTFLRVNRDVRHIASVSTGVPALGQATVLVWARDFDEIASCLSRLADTGQ